jgi:hypothetical protein
MLAALLLAVACVPDTVTWSPTPTVSWSGACIDPPTIECFHAPVPPGEDCAPGCYNGAKPDGYILRWQRPGVAFDNQRRLVLACRTYLDDAGSPVSRFCPGRDLPFAVQKFQGSQLEEIIFTVSAYVGDPANVANEGPRSNTLTICMPKVYPGRPARYE